MITGRSDRPRIQRQSSSPSTPGSITSRTTRLGLPVSIRRRASSPSPASSVVKPSLFRYRTITSRTIGSSSTTRIVVMLLFWPPFRVMSRRPLLVDRAERDPAQGVPRRGMDDGQIEVPDKQHQRRIHQTVVQEHGARETEARVALAEPEQQSREEEEQRERRR